MTLAFEGSSFPTWPADSAMSKEAMYLRDAAHVAGKSAEQSQALFGEKAEAIQQIWRLQEQCAVHDWDGYGGVPMLSEAAQRASDIVRALPRGIPMPEFSTDPDGSIGLDWSSSRSELFSVSVGSTDRLSYAWLDGADRGHGVAVFDGVAIPKKILEGIQGVVGERTRLRVA